MKKFREAAFVGPYRFALEKKREKKTVALTFLRYPLEGWNFLLIILSSAIFSYKCVCKKYVCKKLCLKSAPLSKGETFY